MSKVASAMKALHFSPPFTRLSLQQASGRSTASKEPSTPARLIIPRIVITAPGDPADHTSPGEITAYYLDQALTKCDYKNAVRTKYLRWYRDHILAALSKPIPGKKQAWLPLLTHNHSQFELSIDVCNPGALGGRPDDTDASVRFSIEAIGPNAGSDEDPFNESASFKLIQDLSVIFPKLDLQWFNHFAKE